MQYKSMTLELLQLNPRLYDQLLATGTLLPALDFYANELKESHLAWKERLSQAMPGSSERQIASEALEIALKELEASLAPASPPDENGPLSLDGAMAFIIRHMSAA